MNYLIAQKDIKIKGCWVFKGSKYTLNSEGYFHSFNDLPAIIHPDGYQAWFLNGKLHRSDGPAVIHSDGPQYWYLNGELHREDGPAIIDSNGYQAWYLNGERHREDGPALIYPDGYQEWWLNGYRVRPIEVFKLMKDKGVDITHFALDKNPNIREIIKELL